MATAEASGWSVKCDSPTFTPNSYPASYGAVCLDFVKLLAVQRRTLSMWWSSMTTARWGSGALLGELNTVPIATTHLFAGRG